MRTAFHAWQLEETRYDPETARAREGLFTQGSGYLHIRGSLEEHLTGVPQNEDYLRRPANVTAEQSRPTPARWGTYVPGIFGPHPMLNRQMINLPWFLELALTHAGERLDMRTAALSGYRRHLDMHSATLQRAFTWQTQAGPVLTVQFERFVCADHPHLTLQRLTLTADRETRILLQAGIDADVRTSGHDHFTGVEPRQVDAETALCRVRTNGGDTVTTVTRLSGIPVGAFQAGPRYAGFRFDLALPGGQPVVIEKRSTVATSIDREATEAVTLLDDCHDTPWEQLAATHAAEWAARWARSDVRCEGCERTQQAMRASLYHLLRAHPRDARVAIDAKGYAGDAYFGRFFWDTELNLLPFFLYTQPELARQLCDFRRNTMAGARDNAAGRGYPGARFAWESDDRGHENCAAWQYADHEVHVTADVVYAWEHYAAAAPDADYLRDAARDIVETARYWMARIDLDATGRPVLLGVMGPDEYTPISHNNAYTNWMVARNLRLAAALGADAGATAPECRAFAETAAALPIPRRGELVLQCDEFEALAAPRFEARWPDRKRVFAAQVPQEVLYRTKCLKQADVILLQVLFPEAFTDAECRAAWDYYLPVTTHDSSLSVGIHALMALRLGLHSEAWAFFQRGLYLDTDTDHGGAAEGIHIAGCGCNWMVMVQGFAGVHSALQAERLTLDPHLPAELSRLTFPLTWKGCALTIEVSRRACIMTNRSDQAIEAVIAGTPVTLAPHGTQTIRLPDNSRREGTPQQAGV